MSEKSENVDEAAEASMKRLVILYLKGFSPIEVIVDEVYYSNKDAMLCMIIGETVHFRMRESLDGYAIKELKEEKPRAKKRK